MFLPIGDENPNERTPWVHYGILGANVAVYLYTLSLGRDVGKFFQAWGLVPARFSVLKMFTSMYIHGGIAHVFGNMLFLWIVGDNVEDRLGHLGYLVFYHLAGVAACLAQAAWTTKASLPLVGASGAISGVMGAYAVFFPRAKIKIWYWVWFFAGVTYVSAIWAVGFWFLEQVLLRTLAGPTGVAYEAHVGGVVFGVASALVLRKWVLKGYDSVRRVVRPPGAPAAHRGLADEEESWSPGTWRPVNGAERVRPVEVEVRDALPAEPVPEELATGVDDNAAITGALDAADVQLAYRYFTRATSGGAHTALDEATVLRLGEALLVAGRYGPAARVYEVVVETFPESVDAAEAAFRLGTILSRQFRDYARARTYLTLALETHSDPRRRRQALDELKLIDAYLRRIALFRRSNGEE
jgi:membrane associated rhomboid family serine protease